MLGASHVDFSSCVEGERNVDGLNVGKVPRGQLEKEKKSFIYPLMRNVNTEGNVESRFLFFQLKHANVAKLFFGK